MATGSVQVSVNLATPGNTYWVKVAQWPYPLDHCHILSAKRETDLKDPNFTSISTFLSYLPVDEDAGRNTFRMLLQLALPRDVIVTLRGDQTVHLDIGVKWTGAWGGVETTDAWLKGGAIQTLPPAYLSHEKNDFVRTTGEYYQGTWIKWSGWMIGRTLPRIIFPAGTGHTQPSRTVAVVTLAFTIVGDLRVKRNTEAFEDIQECEWLTYPAT